MPRHVASYVPFALLRAASLFQSGPHCGRLSHGIQSPMLSLVLFPLTAPKFGKGDTEMGTTQVGNLVTSATQVSPTQKHPP